MKMEHTGFEVKGHCDVRHYFESRQLERIFN